MQNRISLALSQQIADDTCSAVSFLFYWKNPYVNGYLVYESLPRGLKKIIKDEIIQFTQSIQLSPTQQEIIGQLSDDSLRQLSKNIAGEIVTEDLFNIVNYQGMKMSGLAAAYFQGFRFLFASVRWSDHYTVFKPQPDPTCGIMPSPIEDPGITYTKLHNQLSDRKKAVIRCLFTELQQFANQQQLGVLLRELTDKNQPDVRKLAVTRGIMSIFSDYSRTTSIRQYEQALLDSIERFKIPNLIPLGLDNNEIASALAAPSSADHAQVPGSMLPGDVHQIIGTMLTKQDFVNLACLNHQAVTIFKKFIETLRDEQNEKREHNMSVGY